jgi:hypothetical protein
MSNIFVEIIDVQVQKVGTYSKMTVTHRHTVAGQLKVDAKAIFSFSTPDEVWKTLEKAQKGDQFVISREKDAKEGKYWNWVGIARDDGTGPTGTGSDVQVVTTAKPAQSKPSFASLDENKQRLIVRQNALTNAVNFQKAYEDHNSIADVLETAEEFAKWVNQGE